MGTKKSEIYPMLLLPFVLVATVGGLVGFLASCAFPLEGVVGNEGYYSIPEIPMITHPLIFLYCVLMPPLVCTLVSLFLMRKKMAQTAASLLVSSSESSGGSGGIVGVTIIGSLLAAAIFMVGRGVGTYATTVAERLPDEIQYNYVYELAEEHKTIPAGAQGAYRHTFSVEDHGYIRDIQFIGIEQGNRYFNVSVADLNGDVIISSAIASRYGLQSGDSLSVFDPLTAESFDFDIREVADYNVQLAIFMDIGDLRSLLDKDGVAFNMVYSDAPLSFSKSQLFDSATKEELIAPVEQLGPEVRSSRNVLYTLGILFYSVMMIYLFQFAVVRKRRDVACLSSLGYRNGEIALSLTGKLVVLACVSAAVSLLVGYHVSLPLMPELLASTPIGIILDYHLPDYLLHLLVATGIILLSALLALWRIASTDILFYLRNRE
ncbi:MAG: FtsX-like permease family protein [Atopobiaceae bacterium]|nr:FtsX-like permease family protein [Atopobiaceae bacterium]